MAKIIKFFLILILLNSLGFSQVVKKADLAGSWYPKDKAKLYNMLNNFLDKASPKKINGDLIGLISPHAGLAFSGPVAAYGYKLLKNIKENIKTVVIVGFNHRFYHEGIAVCDFDYYSTPLGKVEIDKDLTRQLIAQDKNIYSLKKAFYNENSSEMQIPFLQMVLPNFKLVIIHIGQQSWENCQILADALYNVLKKRKKYILIASTDMSHYLTYDETNKLDAYTISQIKKFDPFNLYIKSKLQGHRLMCGFGAVCATIMACKKLGANYIEILKHANSGDVTFNKSRVVGYLSAAIVKTDSKPNLQDPASQEKKENKNKEEDDMELTKEDKKTLIDIARKTLESYLSKGKIPEFKAVSERLKEIQGAFVTLRKHGNLRGCIGNIIGVKPLYITVRDMAIEAATKDPRFPPVTYQELKDIDIEISVLSPLKKVDFVDEIILGKHGVIVKRGFRQGVFLPQVATETGWNKEEFLSYLCTQKAGLPPDSWKDKDTELYVFTACVFSEEDLN